MDFFDRTGPMAIGSRLRMLTDKITGDAAAIYRMYGVDIKPKWFPVFFVLSQGEAKTITAIAREIGHSHPSVSHIVREIAARGLITETKDEADGRRNVVRLSDEGEKTARILEEQCRDVAAAIDRLNEQTENDLWQAIGEWENLLSAQPLLQRVQEEKRTREKAATRIVDYTPCYGPVFRALNEAWITAHWQMEEADYHALDDPETYILAQGGHIFVALYRDEPVGVCALCRSRQPGYDYELAKLAVDPRVRGKGIGRLLCEAVIAKATECGGRKIFLESNTLLGPAIRLYRKLGFEELAEYRPAYERGDIQMELTLR